MFVKELDKFVEERNDISKIDQKKGNYGGEKQKY